MWRFVSGLGPLCCSKRVFHFFGVSKGKKTFLRDVASDVETSTFPLKCLRGSHLKKRKQAMPRKVEKESIHVEDALPRPQLKLLADIRGADF